MPVKALYDYEFPSADRAELFGDDQLVYVHWDGNPLFCSAACFRVPKAMPFGEFVTAIVAPWAGSDPDFDPAAGLEWRLFDKPLFDGPLSGGPQSGGPQSGGPQSAPAGRSLADLGIGHKALLHFSA